MAGSSRIDQTAPMFTIPRLIVWNGLEISYLSSSLVSSFSYLQVRLTFEEPEPGLTVIKLLHTDIPEEDRYGNATVAENTERGWRELIFHKIRAVFGFGI